VNQLPLHPKMKTDLIHKILASLSRLLLWILTLLPVMALMTEKQVAIATSELQAPTVIYPPPLTVPGPELKAVMTVIIEFLQ
jgi:hypothetical protein